MKKNATSVPSAPSTTPLPMDATLRSAVSVARPSHSWMSAADTSSSSRARRANGPITGYCSRRMRMLPSSLKSLPRTKCTSARAWSTNSKASRVSGVSTAKGVRPVITPADTPALPRSLRVSQRCSGWSRKARKIAQAIAPAKGWSTSNMPYATSTASATKKAFV